MADTNGTSTSNMATALQPVTFAWNPRALVPIESWDWDGWKSRQFRYYHSELFYHNQAYSALVNYVDSMKVDLKLGKHIRSIYNPVNRLVEMYVSKSYGGALDMEHLNSGAIKITAATQEFLGALRQVWLWSNWGNKKSVYSRQLAMNGDVGLKVVDNVERKRVRFEVLNANRIKDVTRDSVGNIKDIVIEYKVEVDRPSSVDIFNTSYQPTYYIYTEHITKDDQGKVWFFTYKDRQPFAYVKDATGKPQDHWQSDYGFIPVALAQHRDMDRNWGANCFLDFIPLINEINDQASLLNDQIRKHVNAIWAVSGQQGTDIDLSVDDKDEAPMVFLAQGASITPMVAPLEVGGVIMNLKEMLSELEQDCPELQLYRLQQSGRLTAPGVEAAYSDATDRLTEANGNYNHTLISAQMMAVAIGGHRGYDGFEGFDLDSYEKGDLKHYIADRTIIKDSLSNKETLDYLMALPLPAKSKTRAVLQRLPDFSNADIDTIISDITASPEAALQQAAVHQAANDAGVHPDSLTPPADQQPVPQVTKLPQIQTGTNVPNDANVQK